MLKVGVVGLGVMGQHHARIYSQLDCELVGAADANTERAKEIGEKYGIKYYSDYRDLVPMVEAVSIAVPTASHHTVATDFLREGVHCLVEKPIAFNLHEADEMIEAADRNQVNLAVGHIENFNPAVVKLKQIIDEGTLGKLLIISTRRVGPFVRRIVDVGIVIDSAIHDIGVVKYLIGKDPISIFSRVGNLRHPKEDHAIVVLEFAGTNVCIEVNWFTPRKVRTLVATGSEGAAYLDYIEQKVEVHNSHDLEDVQLQKEEPLKLEIRNFLQSVAEGKKPAVDGIEGRAILKIALESSRNNFYISPQAESTGMDTNRENAFSI
jgi:UDP-N-acetylglucosamine 3-dehydrogenase